MSGLVERAERRGLLARGPNPDDGRAVDVVMTPAGHELAERVYADVRRALGPLTEALGSRERQAVTRLLERMLEH